MFFRIERQGYYERRASSISDANKTSIILDGNYAAYSYFTFYMHCKVTLL